jgi:hypothetical protein
MESWGGFDDESAVRETAVKPGRDHFERSLSLVANYLNQYFRNR